MRKISFWIPGNPKGKGRHKVAYRAGKIHTYTPDDTAVYENLVRYEFKRQCGNFKFGDDAKIKMSVSAHFAIPKSVSGKKGKDMLAGKIRPTKKPDADNIIKIIADSLNKLVYRDDAQIVEVHFQKHYMASPGVDVELQEID